MWFANTHRWRAALTSFSIYSKMLSSLSAHRHRYTCLKMRVASLAWFPGCGWHFLFACTCNPSARAYLFSSSRREQGLNRRCWNDFLNALWPIQIGTVGWYRHCKRTVATVIALVICAEETPNCPTFLQSNAIFHIHAVVCIHQVLELIGLISISRTTQLLSGP